MPGNLFPGLGSALDAGCGDSLHEELLGKHEEDDDREGQVISCTFGYSPSIFFENRFLSSLHFVCFPESGYLYYRESVHYFP